MREILWVPIVAGSQCAPRNLMKLDRIPPKKRHDAVDGRNPAPTKKKRE